MLTRISPQTHEKRLLKGEKGLSGGVQKLLMEGEHLCCSTLYVVETINRKLVVHLVTKHEHFRNKTAPKK